MISDTNIEQDTIVIRRKGEKPIVSAVSVPRKYNRALCQGKALSEWEVKLKKPINLWEDKYYEQWTTRYFKFSDLIKDIRKDLNSGNITDDVYSALINYKSILDEIFARRNIKATSSSPNTVSQQKPAASVTSKKNNDNPGNNGKPWDSFADNLLKQLFAKRFSFDEMAKELQRTKRGIIYRLCTLSLISETERDRLVGEEQPQKSSTTISSKVRAVDKYKQMFNDMNRAKNEFGERAPHKIILLLTIIRKYHSYTGYIITKDLNLQLSFMDCWTKYVQSSHWNPNLNMPWEHMPSEPFWHQDTNPKQASIDPQLQKLIVKKESRNELKQFLIDLLQLY